jgi:transcriptional regulator with XRE-family HTH domain
MSIGENIKKLRELRNYTQSYMSEKLNMSLSGYSKIERDETDISFKRLQQIAEVLETDYSNILEFDGSKVFNINQHQHANGKQNAIAVVQTLNNTENSEALKLIELLRDENIFLKALIEKLSSNHSKLV